MNNFAFIYFIFELLGVYFIAQITYFFLHLVIVFRLFFDGIRINCVFCQPLLLLRTLIWNWLLSFSLDALFWFFINCLPKAWITKSGIAKAALVLLEPFAFCFSHFLHFSWNCRSALMDDFLILLIVSTLGLIFLNFWHVLFYWLFWNHDAGLPLCVIRLQVFNPIHFTNSKFLITFKVWKSFKVSLRIFHLLTLFFF